jgi:hypothetical protein
MIEGVMDYLTENTREAEFLRESCVFKIIPMMNVDGVIHGNNRCSLVGVDLNRRWKDPNKVELFFHSMHKINYNNRNFIRPYFMLKI